MLSCRSEYVINGTKHWISGGGDPRLRVILLLGRTHFPQTTTPSTTLLPSSVSVPPSCSPSTALPRHRQHSIVIVPPGATGVSFLKPLHIFGYDDAPSGHFLVQFRNVRVPVGNLLAEEGMGFAIAQARLGPYTRNLFSSYINIVPSSRESSLLCNLYINEFYFPGPGRVHHCMRMIGLAERYIYI